MKGIAAEASKKLPIDFFGKSAENFLKLFPRIRNWKLFPRNWWQSSKWLVEVLDLEVFFLNQCCLYFRRLFNNEWHLYRNSQSNNRRNSWKNLEFLKKFAKLIPELFPMALLKEFPVELLKNFKENFPKEFHKIPIISFQDFPIPSEIAKKFKKKFLKKNKEIAGENLNRLQTKSQIRWWMNFQWHYQSYFQWNCYRYSRENCLKNFQEKKQTSSLQAKYIFKKTIDYEISKKKSENPRRIFRWNFHLKFD